MIVTWPVAVSEAVDRTWLLPLFGHSTADPPEAAVSLTTANGENVLWPERLSSCTTSDVDAPLLLLDEELELDELLLEEPVPDVELLEEELELDELEELLEDELLLEELLELVVEPPLPVQVGAIKLPSCVPVKPNRPLPVAPGAGNCQLQQLVNWKLVPGLAPVRVPMFH